MKAILNILLFIVLILPQAGSAAVVDVKNIRVWNAPDNTRVVFDLGSSVKYKVFTLAKPDRVVIDMQGVRWTGKLDKKRLLGKLITNVRRGTPQKNTLRVVLDLKEKVSPITQVLKPNEVYGHRLVVDLHRRERKVKHQAPKAADKAKARIKVAIDAGHGGEDYGAPGRRYHAHEKTVVLGIAKELYRLIKKDPDMDADLVRKGDYFIPLRERTRIARQKQQADLFVSIHADSYKNTRASGSSVYVLSRRGATSERAKRLAAKENASDYIGGVPLQNKDPVVRDVLLDLSLTQQISESLDLGADVLKELGKVNKLHKRSVEQAGFVVLKSPDIPSILVETAFISNPKEEKMLKNKTHQKKFAAAIYKGIKHYVKSGRIRKIVAESPTR
ncbi:MAG: N-acetylmuramoyl-L-alanine amidase [Gammaproteobacteria bacterium]|nr:MAG: N-acetylmuramoyl-L-alanine amidase [Gammaproteobacteria bacterium]